MTLKRKYAIARSTFDMSVFFDWALAIEKDFMEIMPKMAVFLRPRGENMPFRI